MPTFPLRAYVSSRPCDKMFHLHIKNNSCEIELIISTLKSSLPLASSLLLMVPPFLLFLKPQTSNYQIFSFASHNGSVDFAFQIPWHLLLSILTLTF